MRGATTSDARIRVLLFTVSPGGVRRHVEEIITQIDHDRFEVIGVFPDRLDNRTYLAGETGSYRNLFAKMGLRTYTVETPRELRPLSCLQSAWKLGRLLRELRPDVLHCHSSMAGAVGRLATLAWRPPLVVYTPHLMYFLRLAGLKRQVFTAVERLLLPRCNALVAVSPSEYQAIRAALGQDPRILRMNNSIPRDLIAANARSQDTALFEELAIMPGTKVILSTARFDNQKDIPTLIRATSILGRKRSDFVVLLAGDGAQRPRIEAVVDAEGMRDRLRILGWRSDVRRLVAACDVMVLSSHIEGLPYALLEAMVLQKPVVASDVGGIRDCVASGVTGLLFPCGDAATLARDLERLLDNPTLCRTMGEKGRAMAMREFPPRGMIEALEALYARAGKVSATSQACRRGGPAGDGRADDLARDA